MAQTFYIEADEEIISVVGRLRHTTDTEIALVVPKRAILMQSIVSLKLLEREAKKIGKVIMIVSQDDNGRALAEKAGLATRSYQEEQVRHEESLSTQSDSTRPISNAPEPTVAFSEPKTSYAIKAENIGSESFFALEQGARSSVTPVLPHEEMSAPKKPSTLRVAVRDKSPQYQTALNSKQNVATQSMPSRSAENSMGTPSFIGVPAAPIEKKSFIGMTPLKQSFAPPRATAKALPPIQLPVAIRSRIKLAITGAGIAVLLLIGGVSFFLFTPKATITVLPQYSKEQNTFEFRLISAGNDTAETEENSSTLEVPYRVTEASIDVPMTVTPTGVGSAGERKARGKVIIYNNFSGEAQPLVATTRFETGNGIIFRLTQGVIVPGMNDIAGKKEPGAIEAEVIADQPGDSSNITPTTFTIPGFKGNAKYDKFSAKSLSSMTGGSNNGASGDPLLTINDVEQAKKLAREQTLDMFRQKMSGTLLEGEKIEESGIELTATSEEPVLHEGLVGASIETTFHYQIKAYIVSEQSLERAILRILSDTGKLKTSTGLTLIPKTVTIDSIELMPDFKLGGGKLKATASLLLSTEIKTDALQNELLGKRADELRKVLDQHPEIVKMNLEIRPNIFLKYIPKDKSRVTVLIAEPEPDTNTAP